MIIRDFGSVANSEARVIFATVVWEDCGYPGQELIFETRDDRLDRAADEPCADAFLCACFPLAAVHGESRVRIEGHPCPMLVDGLYTAHAWWTSWGGPSAVPSSKLPVGASAGNPPAMGGALHFFRAALTAFIC